MKAPVASPGMDAAQGVAVWPGGITMDLSAGHAPLPPFLPESLSLSLSRGGDVGQLSRAPDSSVGSADFGRERHGMDKTQHPSAGGRRHTRYNGVSQQPVIFNPNLTAGGTQIDQVFRRKR
jgi:hypothetical protein